MHPLVRKHLDGHEVTPADVCGTIRTLEELDGYQNGLLEQKALIGDAVLAIEARRAQIIAGRK